jgi:hypothetical protein
MRNASTPMLGRWAWLALWITAGTVLLTDANRFMPPGGEKFADYFLVNESEYSGGVDLLPSFVAAHAWLAGQNPYHFKMPKLPNPWTSGEKFTYVYPPTHFLVYVPLVRWAGKKFEKFARAQFFASVAATVLLALAMLELVHRALPLSAEQRATLLPTLVFVLALNPGSQLGFERGQTDTVSAALCWWGAALFARRKYAWAMFLATAGGLLKGYGLPFAAGLWLLGLRRKSWRGTLIGSGLAILLLLAPVARYLPSAWASFQERSQMFWSSWNNGSIYNLFYVINPHRAPAAYVVVVILSACVTALAWWRTRKALQQGSAGEQSAALVMYTTASLLFILACSKNSIVYDIVLILPGALCLAMLQTRLLFRPSKLEVAMLGMAMPATLFALCAMSVPRVIGRNVPLDFPSHAVGQIALMLLVALLCLRAPSGLHWSYRGPAVHIAGEPS